MDLKLINAGLSVTCAHFLVGVAASFNHDIPTIG
jgi:hypothetical protein